MKKLLKATIALVCATGLSAAWAGVPSHVELEEIKLDMSQSTLQAGAHTVIENCVQCHSLKYIKYRHFLDIGFTQEQIDEMRGEKDMNDRFERVMEMSMVKDMFGMVPPDLSLITKARAGGHNYLYSLLVGYQMDEEGNSDNKVFPGIKMPDVMSYSFSSTDEERAAVRAQAAEVSSFLSWAADPHAEQRETIGTYVVAYLIFLSFLYYALKKRIWARVGERQAAEAAHRNQAAADTEAKASNV